MFFSLFGAWRTIESKVTVKSELLMEGGTALEQIIRAVREEMVDLVKVRYASTGLTNALVILQDINGDGVGDRLKGWGLRVMDANGDGIQDRVDMNDDGTMETPLWELVEVSKPGTNLASSVSWNSTVLCRNVVAPWTSLDGRYVYRPFCYAGRDPALDKSPKDGYVSETELDVNANGVLDVVEYSKIATIHLGLKLVKMSAIRDVESVIVYQGTMSPRNWQPLGKYY
ncbi:MAG: hypothetical protein FJ222_02520 [Lentisphaerae bacterium]|nr:hypothetical protein [Lentisphaerota bacterium]